MQGRSTPHRFLGTLSQAIKVCSPIRTFLSHEMTRKLYLGTKSQVPNRDVQHIWIKTIARDRIFPKSLICLYSHTGILATSQYDDSKQTINLGLLYRVPFPVPSAGQSFARRTLEPCASDVSVICQSRYVPSLLERISLATLFQNPKVLLVVGTPVVRRIREGQAIFRR